uniref:Uncharacterized protein n=1 Tax=Anguilla anguilla TaxID=7936 RepID=A0A0E9TEH3_ANGAN
MAATERSGLYIYPSAGNNRIVQLGPCRLN